MQPYFFPYLGYYQLLNSVDTFVFLDDVAYINKGWVNRNRIHVNGEIFYLTVPLNKSSQNKKINEIEINQFKKSSEKILKTVQINYKKSKNFDLIFSIILDSFKEVSMISELSKNSILNFADYLGIQSRIVNSSSIYLNSYLKGQDRIIDICKIENAGIYLNLSGGMNLYDGEVFSRSNIILKFLQHKNFSYIDSIPANLSIIDVAMNIPRDEIVGMINE